MSFAVVEPVVRLILILCQSDGADNRIQICRLGEFVFVPLLRVWKNKPADRLKVIHCCDCHFVRIFNCQKLLLRMLTEDCYMQDDLVQFCQLQMSLHHPRGAVDEAGGAFAVDWLVWKVSLFCISFHKQSKVQ